jgi:hypothetical protein
MPDAGFHQAGTPKQVKDKLVLYRNINGYFVMPPDPCPRTWTVALDCFWCRCHSRCRECRVVGDAREQMHLLATKRPNKERAALLSACRTWIDAIDRAKKEDTLQAKRDNLELFL